MKPLAHNRLPYRSLGDRFVGREAELEAIRQRLQRDRTAVIQGAGLMGSCRGLGKSRLALEYAHRFGEHYPGGVFWLDAGRGLAAAADQLADSAGIEVDGRAGPAARLHRLFELLAARDLDAAFPRDTGRAPDLQRNGDPGPASSPPAAPWGGSSTGRDACVTPSQTTGATLLILDNFSDDEDLEDWLPPAGPLRTLATTKRQDLGGFGLIQLEPLGQAESARLLTLDQPQAHEAARELAGLLGGLPLALQIARGCLWRRPRLSPQDLAGRISAAAEEPYLADFLWENRDRLPSGCSRRLAGVLLLAWKQASLRAQSLLLAMAFLAPLPVPRPLLAEIVEKGSWARRLWRPLRRLLTGRSAAEAIELAVRELSRLGLVDLDRDGDPRLHPLTASFVRCAASSPQRVLERVVTVTQTSLPVTPEAPESALKSSRKRGSQAGMPVSLLRLLPHAEHLARPRGGQACLAVAPTVPAAAAVELCRSLARCHHCWERIDHSAHWQRLALQRAERELPESPLVTACQAELGQVLQELGQFEESCRLLRLSLETDAGRNRLDHHSLTARRTTLALLLKHMGLFEEAAEQLRQVLAADLQRRPPDPLDVAKAQSNLAGVLLETGRLEEASRLLRQALETARSRLGRESVGLAVIRSNLASVLVKEGEIHEARSQLFLAHETLSGRESAASSTGPSQKLASQLTMEALPASTGLMPAIHDPTCKAEDPVSAYVGRRLRDIRVARGLSRDWMARRVGMPLDVYSGLEQGRSKIYLDSLFSILAALEAKYEDVWPPDEWIHPDLPFGSP